MRKEEKRLGELRHIPLHSGHSIISSVATCLIEKILQRESKQLFFLFCVDQNICMALSDEDAEHLYTNVPCSCKNGNDVIRRQHAVVVKDRLLNH